jgi:hypothetical protein
VGSVDTLIGRQVLPNRPDATIGEVRQVEEGILLTIRWGSVPVLRFPGRMTPVAITWLRCSEREPDLVVALVRKWISGEYDDLRISDAEPPSDVPCGGWISPNGKHWRGSEVTHPIVARRIAQQLGLSLGPHDAERWLMAHGWIHMLDGGQCFNEALVGSLSQAQRDTLFDLATGYPTMRESIMGCLRRYDDG